MSCQHCGVSILPGRKFCSRTCSNRANARRGEEHHNWKGDEAGYFAVHDWITRQYGQPVGCEECGTTDPVKRYEWSNISGRYRRERADFRRLCKSCHNTIDGVHRHQQPNNRVMRQRKGVPVSSPYRGVRGSGYGTWRATIKGHNLGTFTTQSEAAIAWNKAALEVFGEAAFQNEIRVDS